MTEQNDYGEKDWELLWWKLEQEWNVWIDYVINPYLYSEIAGYLSDKSRARMVDFWAGTNILGIQFFYGYQAAVPGLKTIVNLPKIRKNIDEFIGLEWSAELVARGKSYLRDLGYPNNIDIEHFEIRNSNRTRFEDKSVTLAVSRNLLMHLSTEDLKCHFEEVARVLEDGGSYIFAALNPDYEQRKFQDLHPEQGPLTMDSRYAFSHGENGEHGIFHHYWRSLAAYELIFELYFTIESRESCCPIVDDFITLYPRYYQKDMPMAYVYHLKKK